MKACIPALFFVSSIKYYILLTIEKKPKPDFHSFSAQVVTNVQNICYKIHRKKNQ